MFNNGCNNRCGLNRNFGNNCQRGNRGCGGRCGGNNRCGNSRNNCGNQRNGCGNLGIEFGRGSLNNEFACPQEEIDRAIAAIQEGIEVICQGLREIEACCNVCEAALTIEQGVCLVEAGTAELICILKSVCFVGGCESKRILEDGICKILEGIEEVCRALPKITTCRVAEGTEEIREAICLMQEGLCEVIKELECMG